MLTRRSLLLLGLALSAFASGCGGDDENTSQPPPPPELSTIAEARKKELGDVVRIEGVVTVEPGTFFSGTGDVGFALQDETAGIYINNYDVITAALGSKMSVIGRVAAAVGQTVIETNITGISEPEPGSSVMPKDMMTGSINESTEGLLVRVSGNVSKAIVDEKPYGIKAFVDDGSGEVEIYVNLDGENKPLVDTTKLTVGAPVAITGFAQQYGDVYEIAPRKATDLVVK